MVIIYYVIYEIRCFFCSNYYSSSKYFHFLNLVNCRTHETSVEASVLLIVTKLQFRILHIFLLSYSAEPKLWSTEVMKWPKLWTKSWKPKPHSIGIIVIFNRSYELIEVMNYRSYEVNLWTKSKNLRLICDRSYEVKETVNFVFMKDCCVDDHKHVVLVSMSERKRNSISIKSRDG